MFEQSSVWMDRLYQPQSMQQTIQLVKSTAIENWALE
jgi:hypothetical protein